MAGPNVTTTIKIVGDDRASAVIGSIGNAFNKAAKGAQHIADNAEGAAEKAGDMERGFRGVKDILGQVGGAELQGITDKFGGIEAIIKGFGPKLGLVGLALAGVGAAAAYWYEQTEKTRKAAIDLQIQAIQASKGDIDAQAHRLGIAAELIGKKREELTTEGVIAQAKEHANKTDDLRVKLLEAQKEKQTDQIAIINAQIADTRALLAVDGQRLERAKQIAAEMREGQAQATRESTREIANQARIANIMDQRDRLSAQAADVAAKRYTLESSQLRLQAEIKAGIGDRLTAEKELQSIVQARIGLDQRERAIAAEGQARADAIRAKAEAAAAAAAARRKARAAEAARFDDELAAHRRDIEQRATEFANAAYVAEKAQRAEREADQARLRAAGIAAAASPEESFELTRIDLEIQKRQQLDQAKELFAGNDAARALRTQAIEAEFEVRKNSAHAAELERLRQVKVSEADRVAKRVADAKRQRDEERAQRDQEISGALAVASAVVGAAEMMGASQREVAGLRAAIAAVDAIRLAYEEKYVQAALAAVAAVQYGYIAAGGGLGSGGGAGAASTASAGMAESGSEKRALAGSGGGGNVIINYNKPFYGSSQENAKGIAGTLKSLKSTGYGAYKGA